MMIQHPYHWRCLWLALSLMICLSVGGCGLVETSSLQGTSIDIALKTIPTPPGFYGRLTWVDDWLVLMIVPPSEKTVFASRLWRLHPDGSNAEQLPLPPFPGCDRQGVVSPERLPDKRLGYIVNCFPDKESALANLQMMGYSLTSGQTAPLVSYPLPSQQIGTGGFSWDSAMTIGITSDGNGRGLYEQLYWLHPDRPEALDVGLPQAFAATWAPNGTQIAFLGAQEQGLEGVARADASFNLYLMQPDGSKVRPLVQDLYAVASLAWSPDSRWLVVPASHTKNREDKALWLVEVATGKCRQIARGDFASLVWSPDGEHLALLRYKGAYPNEQVEVVIADIGSVLGTP